MSHAILSPSSAHRWLNCPPSAKINAEAPQTDTQYTREGTLAHALGEKKARMYFLDLSREEYSRVTELLRSRPEWNDEMENYTDDYLDALKDIAAGYDAPPHVALEQRVDFSEYVPEGYGTADCIMIGPIDGEDVLNVIDFKYGKGVAVSVEDNPQLKLYALGALLDYDPIYDIAQVRMTVVQPRIRSEPESWDILPDSLLTWANLTVEPTAKLAAEGKGDFAAGDWCRFCAIRATCRARYDKALALDGFVNGRAPAELTDAEVGEALTLGQRLADWLSDLQEYALTACLEGKSIPGWKAVEGRSVRGWTDQDAAFSAAMAAGIPGEMLYERKPVSLAALEKIMGRKAFSDTMADYVTTPSGKPTLARADDKRKAITGRPSAEDDFAQPLPF